MIALLALVSTVFSFGNCLILQYNATQETNFILFTRSYSSSGQQLFIGDNGSVSTSNFKSTLLTKFVIHGLNQNGNATDILDIKDAYLNNGDFNVIVVDWGVLAGTDFASATLYVPLVGGLVANLIDFLVTSTNIATKSIGLVGFSLGAHVSGYAGQLIDSGRIGSIVGLDPAGPGYIGLAANQRLSADDADYVACIHTNGLEYGHLGALGHADFYPNYGKQQPGCGIVLPNVVGCSHGRAQTYFTESLIKNKKSFVGKSCSDEYLLTYLFTCSSSGKANAIMGGEPLDLSARGLYYLKTNSAAPFAVE